MQEALSKEVEHGHGAVHSSKTEGKLAPIKGSVAIFYVDSVCMGRVVRAG